MSISKHKTKDDNLSLDGMNRVVDVESLDTMFEDWDDKPDNPKENSGVSKLSKNQNNPKKRRNDHRQILNELASLIPIHGVCSQLCRKKCPNSAIGADTCLLLKYVITYLRLKQVINGPDFGIKRINRLKLQNEPRNNNLFENSLLQKYPNAISIVMTDSFECLYISMGIYHLTGITQASIIGKSITEFIHPGNNITSLFFDDISSHCNKSCHTLQFNEIQNSYIQECICKNNSFCHTNEETTYTDPYTNLNRKTLGVRFKSIITYQGVNLSKQGSHCYIDMTLMCCVRKIACNQNDNLHIDLSSSNRRFLIGILVPFYMPKLTKIPSHSFYFFTYHNLCLQTQLMTLNPIQVLNQKTEKFSWYNIIHPLHLKRLCSFHKEILNIGFVTFTHFQLKNTSSQLVSKGYLYNCPNNSQLTNTNTLIVLYHEIIKNSFSQKGSIIERFKEQNHFPQSNIHERIPYILSNANDESLFLMNH